MGVIKFKIITPKGLFYEGEADIINLPLTKGMTGILPSHFPLVSTIEIGELVFRYKGVSRTLAISGGVLHVQKEETLILANSIEFKEDIDLDRAKECEKRARERLEKKDSTLDIKRAEIALRKALNRIKIAEK
jgi:F-type H+-transporting ATPase subunit epsilon